MEDAEDVRLGAWWREPTHGQWFSFAGAWLGWVLDAFDFTVFLLVMPHIAREFGVQNIATTGSIALTLMARLVGGFVAGAAADRWGRKLPLMLSIVWFALCDGAVAFAPSFGWILVLRTLFGFGMGAEWTAGTTLAMENWPARSRGIVSGILQGSWAIGYLAAAAVSVVVLPLWGWRALFVIAAAPALVVLFIRQWVPESEEWKASQKAGGARRARDPFVFAPGTLTKLAWASAAMAIGFGAYYGLTGLYPTMLKTELAMSDRQVAWLVMIFNIGMLAGSVACGVIAARRSATIAIVVCALIAVPCIPLYVGTSPSLLAVGSFCGGAFGVGFCGAVPLLLTDLFPAEERGRLVGLAYHIGAFFAAFVPMGTAALARYAGISLARSLMFVAIGCELALVTLIVWQRVRAVAVAPGAGVAAIADP